MTTPLKFIIGKDKGTTLELIYTILCYTTNILLTFLFCNKKSSKELID